MAGTPETPSHDAREMTLGEWAALPEDDEGELVDGLLEEEEAPAYAHGVVVVWLATALSTFLRGKGGFVGGSDAKFAVSPRRGRKPDLTVYLPGSRPPQRRGLVTVPPDIAVEVVSPSPRDQRRDRVDKMDEYAAFGVKYYWLVDPALESLEVFELEGGRYARALAATAGKVERVPGCAGLVLDLDELWAALARLGDGTEDAR